MVRLFYAFVSDIIPRLFIRAFDSFKTTIRLYHTPILQQFISANEKRRSGISNERISSTLLFSWFFPKAQCSHPSPYDTFHPARLTMSHQCSRLAGTSGGFYTPSAPFQVYKLQRDNQRHFPLQLKYDIFHIWFTADECCGLTWSSGDTCGQVNWRSVAMPLQRHYDRLPQALHDANLIFQCWWHFLN